jgi:hypothetical protein
MGVVSIFCVFRVVPLISLSARICTLSDHVDEWFVESLSHRYCPTRVSLCVSLIWLGSGIRVGNYMAEVVFGSGISVWWVEKEF